MVNSPLGSMAARRGFVHRTISLFWSLRFARYIAAGGISFLIDYGLLVGLTEILGIHYLISASVGFSVGALVCYGLSVVWVFDARRYDRRVTEAALFFIIGLIGLGLNDLLLWSLADGLGWPYQYSKLIVAGLVLVFNYSTRLLLLFTEHLPSANPP